MGAFTLSLWPSQTSDAKPCFCAGNCLRQGESQVYITVGTNKLEIAEKALCVQWRLVCWIYIPRVNTSKPRAHGFCLQIRLCPYDLLEKEPTGHWDGKQWEQNMSYREAGKSASDGKSQWHDLRVHYLCTFRRGSGGPIPSPMHWGAHPSPLKTMPFSWSRSQWTKVPAWSLWTHWPIWTRLRMPNTSEFPVPTAPNSLSGLVWTSFLGLAIQGQTIFHLCTPRSKGWTKEGCLEEKTFVGKDGVRWKEKERDHRPLCVSCPRPFCVITCWGHMYVCVCVCVCVSHSRLQKLLYSAATSGRQGGPLHLNHVPPCHEILLKYRFLLKYHFQSKTQSAPWNLQPPTSKFPP